MAFSRRIADPKEPVPFAKYKHPPTPPETCSGSSTSKGDFRTDGGAEERLLSKGLTSLPPRSFQDDKKKEARREGLYLYLSLSINSCYRADPSPWVERLENFR